MMSSVVGSMNRSKDSSKSGKKKAYHRALRYYRKLKGSSKNSDVDQRLINYFDEKINEFENKFT